MTYHWNPTFGPHQQNLVQGMIGGLTGLPAPGVIEGVPLTIGPSALVGADEPSPAGPSAAPSVYGYDLTGPLSSSVVYPVISDGWSTHGGRTALRASFDPLTAYLELERFLLTRAKAQEKPKCTEWTLIDCPEGGKGCGGKCKLRVCAEYDNLPDGTITNLRITFEGMTEPAGNDAASLAASKKCKWDFNIGEGWIRYVTPDGKSHRLFSGEEVRFGAEGQWNDVVTALNEQYNGLEGDKKIKRDDIQRKYGDKHCSEWSKEDRDWWKENVLPKNEKGWELEWECQDTESPSAPRAPGFSVRRIRSPKNVKIKRFDMKFTIAARCLCGDRYDAPNNTAPLVVELSGP